MGFWLQKALKAQCDGLLQSDLIITIPVKLCDTVILLDYEKTKKKHKKRGED